MLSLDATYWWNQRPLHVIRMNVDAYDAEKTQGSGWFRLIGKTLGRPNRRTEQQPHHMHTGTWFSWEAHYYRVHLNVQTIHFRGFTRGLVRYSCTFHERVIDLKVRIDAPSQETQLSIYEDKGGCCLYSLLASQGLPNIIWISLSLEFFSAFYASHSPVTSMASWFSSICASNDNI